jgi:glycosyltransferase involved in cell wall biosynthesis
MSGVAPRPLKVVMALENNPYPQDVRVRNEALELLADGHEVVVLAPRDEGQRRHEVVDGVRVKRYWLPEREGAAGIAIEYAVAAVQLTLRLLVELARGAEVIHLHNPPDLLFGVAALARATGRAVVFDHHDLAPELFEQKFGPRWPASILRWCERMTMRAASVVVSANESHRLIAIERGGVEAERVVVVRNAPRTSTIASGPHTRAGALKDPRLCYLGSLGSQDGVRVLPELVWRLARAGLDPTLLIVGDGPELPVLRSLAQEHDVLDRIDFVGRVAHVEVPRLLETADICIDVAPCTPLNHCSTMIKIGEYLAAGRPIVSFELQETRHTAADCAVYAAGEDLGSLCEAIVSLCGDEQARATLSRRGLARAREMTWEDSADRLRASYTLASEALAGV